MMSTKSLVAVAAVTAALAASAGFPLSQQTVGWGPGVASASPCPPVMPCQGPPKPPKLPDGGGGGPKGPRVPEFGGGPKGPDFGGGPGPKGPDFGGGPKGPELPGIGGGPGPNGPDFVSGPKGSKGPDSCSGQCKCSWSASGSQGPSPRFPARRAWIWPPHAGRAYQSRGAGSSTGRSARGLQGQRALAGPSPRTR